MNEHPPRYPFLLSHALFSQSQVLYDKDHYKLALGQLHTAKQLMSRIADDYVRLLKYVFEFVATPHDKYV